MISKSFSFLLAAIVFVHHSLQVHAQNSYVVSTDIRELQQHLADSHHTPLCVLVRATGGQLERSLLRLWSDNSQRKDRQFASWKLTAVNTTQTQRMPSYLLLNAQVPESSLLRCFLGPTLSHDFVPSAPFRTKHLLQWLDQLVMRHRWLESASVETIESSAKHHRFTLVVFPTVHQHQEVEQAVFQVSSELSKECSINVIVLHPSSTNLREVLEKYHVNVVPSVLLVEKDVDMDQKQTLYNIHDLTTNRMEVDLRARLVAAPQLTRRDFEAEVVRVKVAGQHRPYLIGFFAHWQAESSLFLSFLRHTVEEFASLDAELQFGLVDAASSPAVVSHFMSPGCLNHLPFLALFHTAEGASSVSKSELLLTRPSPYSVFTALQEAGFILRDRQHRPIRYQPYGHNTQMCSRREGPDGDLCSADNTTWLFPAEYLMDFLQYQPSEEAAVEPGSDVSSRGVSLAGPDDWVSPLPLYAGNTEHSVRISVFMFVRHPCHSCERSLPLFEDIYRQLSTNDSYTVRLVNCSQTLQACEEQHVRGFPTILAFRWHHTAKGCADQCLSTENCPLPVRQDYHGVLTVAAVMDWILSVSLAPVTALHFSTPHWIQRETAQLVATVIAQDSDYLPRPPHKDPGYFYSTVCFREVCERLYGLVSCVTVNSPDVPASHFSSDQSLMVITKVIFRRRDGVEVTVMHLGQSLAVLLEEEIDSALHMFHTAHSYSLHQTLKCEDDHSQCTQFLESFSRDHLRLPVTPLTSDILHSHNKFQFVQMPVLLALVETDPSAEFRMVLETVAYTLYKEVVVSTLDVHLYPAWAGSFVPRSYSSRQAESGGWGELGMYPRLCMFYWQDHTRAAFYPPITPPPSPSSQPHTEASQAALLTEDLITQFAQQFLQDPDSMLVETEQF